MLHEWAKKAEIDSGARVGMPSDVAAQLNIWNARTTSCARRTRFCVSAAAKGAGEVRLAWNHKGVILSRILST